MITFIEKYKVDPGLCDQLIDYFKNNKEHKHRGTPQSYTDDKNIKDSTDVFFFNASNNKHICSFFDVISECVSSYMIKYKVRGYLTTESSNNIQYYKPGGGYPQLHYERGTIWKDKDRQLVYMLYLNTVTDKGGTHFPYQNITKSAIKGDLLIWPADFTHPHQGVISPTQEKYIVTGWFVVGESSGKKEEWLKENQ